MTERQWHQVALAAVVVMAVVLLAHLVVPVPSAASVVRALRRQDGDLRTKIEKARDDVSATRAENETKVWTQPADQVSAAALARVTELAKAQSLKVLAFRPQKAQEGSGVTRYPYQISVEGYFPKVVAFVRALETPKLKLPVVSVQIAAADGATDKVSSTIGIVAFKETVTTP